MTLRNDLADARIRRAHLIDMESMKEPCQPGCTDCAACRAKSIVGACIILALGVGIGYTIYRKVKHSGT